MAGTDYRERLFHILDAIAGIEVLEGIEQDSPSSQRDIRQRALERYLEIISEASRHLPDSLKTRYPDIP